MHRLGYTRYVAQGGDVGALVTDLMGRQGVEGLVGYHLNLLTAVLAIGDHLPGNPNRNAERPRRCATFRQHGFGCFLRWPRGRGRSATPAGLHRRARSVAARPRHGRLLQDLRAFGGTASLSAYSPRRASSTTSRCTGYRRGRVGGPVVLEDARALRAALAGGRLLPPVTVPVGFTTFPGGSGPLRAAGSSSLPRPRLLQRGQPGRPLRGLGGPQLYFHELRAAFRSLRFDAGRA